MSRRIRQEAPPTVVRDADPALDAEHTSRDILSEWTADGNLARISGTDVFADVLDGAIDAHSAYVFQTGRRAIYTSPEATVTVEVDPRLLG